ncbi:hypothetical protein [Caballeronia sp. GaOx3]|uniref:hypothetical protein n=1 Tax=Caballeronia sp. GaOx3 TaxID=2921740 RepID=UPI0020280197|nr:hypothetical protein [Caballeronia sp. GaOx3]
MGNNLHSLVAAKALNDPAILIADALLIELLSRRLGVALSKYLGYYQQYPGGTGPVQIGLTACSYDSKNTKWAVSIPPNGAAAGLFYFETSQSISVVFSVTKSGDPTLGVFTVNLDIEKISAIGRAGYNLFSITDVAVDFKSKINEDPDAVKNSGLTAVEIARLQGLVEGSVAPTVLRNIFAEVPSIDIRSLFPAIVFKGTAELAAIDGGMLVIAKDGWFLDETQRCSCSASAPEVRLKPGVPIDDNRDGRDGQPVGGSVPISVQIPPPRNPPWPVETGVRPDVALYLPQPTVSAITSGPYPAVNDFASDNGFIGWSYDYSIGFMNARPSLTDPRATLVLTIEFYVSGSGNVSVDVPCIGRSTVGMLWATNREGGPSIIEFGVSPRLQSDGKISLVPELLSLQIQPFKVDCIVIALSLLSYFGPWGTLAAFVLNEIFKLVIAHNLPPVLNAGLRDAMSKQVWTLIDLSKLDVGAIFGKEQRLGAAVSREPNSLLIGLAGHAG